MNNLQYDLEQFYGTQYYHRVSLFPVYATDGVTYFCERASAFWLFDEMAEFAMSNKDEHFIVAIAKSTPVESHTEVTLIFEDGNKGELGKRHFEFSDLPEGEWKFYISNHPEQKVILLPSEY